ncbi:hypothetical protein [Mesorhizobium australicum]|uniref:Uncharacterized protein n=1 Tax=Mesorhizobium australicum TaxID=536018 RepID=A0A1X7PE02_9HYPH|nr:hypothetical protein [Mesorhizobium australicum]SMH48907.1 hypothetical protein SAMN02982922_3816 [Mesorhizobium australicum]
MSLPVLAALVVVGVGLIVTLIHLTGGSRKASLVSADAARARFALDYPNVEVRAVHLTTDRCSAFLETADGRIGLVHAMGAKFLTRLVAPEDVASLRRSGEASLLVRFSDFTFPGAVFEFESAEVADRVAAALTRRTVDRRAA